MISPKLLALPEILRRAGCEVVEWPGWQSRQRPWDFAPVAVMLHHDASPVGESRDWQAQCRFLFEVGRPSEGIPAPLCQLWIDYHGRWVIGAAGGANHAGLGVGWGAVPANQGNQRSIGVEMDNTMDEPTTPAQYEALHKGLPAIFTAFAWNPLDALTAHKEYAAGRKPDPDDIDMPLLRRDVVAGMHTAPPDDQEEDTMQYLVTYQGIWLVAGDLSTRTGFSSMADLNTVVAAGRAAGQKYASISLSPGQMARIPVAGAVKADVSTEDLQEGADLTAEALAEALAGEGSPPPPPR